MFNDTIHLDFETRSAVDLKKSGLHVYASDKTTDIWCCAFAFGEEETEIWYPGLSVPTRLVAKMASGGVISAHNAPFEVAINNEIAHKRYGFPLIKIEQMECTMTMAAAMSLPLSLDKLARALGLEIEKDMKGYRVMMQLSQPRSIDSAGNPVWRDDKEKIEKLFSYCKQDVNVEREVRKRLLALTEREKKIWHLDQKINNLGVKIDLKSVKKAIEIVEKEKLNLDQKMRELTNHQVASCNATMQLTSWLRANLPETFVLDGIAKDDIRTLLASKELSPQIRACLSLRQQAGKSSTAKLLSMREGVSKSERLNGLFQYHGATTGRWSGRRIQPQNFPRGRYSEEDIDRIFSSFNLPNPAAFLSLTYGSPLQVISDVLRSFLIADEGKELIWVDFSSIEARVLAWLSNEKSVLDVFKGDGLLYEHTAAKIYQKELNEISKEERQIGKVATLALGYGGGKFAFKQMAENYGLVISEELADEVKIKWRAANRNIVRFWYGLEEAAKTAVENPNKIFSFLNVRYKKLGSFLFCELPSKRVLCYPYPEIKDTETPWGEKKPTLTYMSEDSMSKKWERQKAYGGLLAENVTQAVARDLLAESMLRLDSLNFPIVMHVHDEIVLEVLKGKYETKKIEELVCRNPDWALGLPIAAEAKKGFRYSK